MIRKKSIITLLLLLILLTPAYVLIVHGIECSDFPEIERVSEVEYRFLGNDREETVGSVKKVDLNSTLYRLIYVAFSSAKRVSKSKVPDHFAEYKFTFKGEELGEEVLYFYVSQEDFSVYIKSSENKYFEVKMPSVSLGSNLLPPSAMTISFENEDVITNYDYPEYPNGETAIASIRLSRWENVPEFVYSSQDCSCTYTMHFNKTGLSKTVSDPSSIINENPDSVLLEMTGSVVEGVKVLLRYYISVQN